MRRPRRCWRGWRRWRRGSARWRAGLAARDPQGRLDAVDARLEGGARADRARWRRRGRTRSPAVVGASSRGSMPRRTRRPRRCSRGCGWRRGSTAEVGGGATRRCARSTASRRAAGARLRERVAAAGGAGGEPVRGGLGAADAALRAEGRGDRGGAGAAGAAGGAARRGGGRARRAGSARRSTASPPGWRRRRRCARRRRRGCASGSRCWRRRGRARSRRSSEQLTRLYAQKDAAAEGCSARLGGSRREAGGARPARRARRARGAGRRCWRRRGRPARRDRRRSSRSSMPRRTRRPRRCSARLEETLRRIAALEAAGAPFAEIVGAADRG